jgi:hypothetical protein
MLTLLEWHQWREAVPSEHVPCSQCLRLLNYQPFVSACCAKGMCTSDASSFHVRMFGNTVEVTVNEFIQRCLRLAVVLCARA